MKAALASRSCGDAGRRTDDDHGRSDRECSSMQAVIEQFLYREARYLDDREFGSWLGVLRRRRRVLDAVLGRRRHAGRRPAERNLADLLPQPGWPGGPRLPDPTERSSATSLPEPRTSHNINNVEVIEQARRPRRRALQLVTHVSSATRPSTRTSARRSTRIDFSGEQPLIRRKKVVLKNDYIHHVRGHLPLLRCGAE